MESEQHVTLVRWHADGPARRTKPHGTPLSVLWPRARRPEGQRLPGDDAPERDHLVVGEFTPLPRTERTQSHGPIRTRTSRDTGSPTAASRRRTSRFRPSVITRRTAPRSPICRRRARPSRGRGHRPARPPGADARCASGRHALDLGEVLLLHAESRVGQTVREIAVVHQQEQPFAVPIEPSHGEHARPVGRQVGADVGAPLGSCIVVTTPGGLCNA